MKQTNEEESKLIQLVKEGDASAFSFLYKKYLPRATALAYKITGDKSIANDIGQDALVKAYQHIRKYKDQHSFETWINGIVRKYPVRNSNVKVVLCE